MARSIKDYSQKYFVWILFGLILLLSVLAILWPSSSQSTHDSFRPGDVGFSYKTPQGEVWVYGDSWHNNKFIRNAITLNGQYIGSFKSPAAGTWIWPGPIYRRPDGRLGMYGSQTTQAKPGMWGTKRLGSVQIAFKTNNIAGANIKLSGKNNAWTSASLNTGNKTFVYGVDGSNKAQVASINQGGNAVFQRIMGGWISGRFSVIQDRQRKWWMVGFLPWLSRRLVAYPLDGPAGRVTGPYRLLKTMPDPAAGLFVYDGLIHPELGGMLTWAMNGKNVGSKYGLYRIQDFWINNQAR